MTGAVRAPALRLNSSATVGVAQDVTELTRMAEEARAKTFSAEAEKTQADKDANEAAEQLSEMEREESDLQTKLDELKAKTGDDAAAPEAIQSAQNDLDVQKGKVEDAKVALSRANQAASLANKNLTDAKQEVEFLEQVLRENLNGQASTAGQAFLEQVKNSNQIDAETSNHLSKAVVNIVKEFYDQTFFEEVCTTIFTSMVDGDLDDQALESVSIYLKSKRLRCYETLMWPNNQRNKQVWRWIERRLEQRTKDATRNGSVRMLSS